MNNLWPLIGNEHISEYLSRSLKKGDINQTYIFTGPEDLGKTTAARFFAQCLLCAEPDPRTCLPCGGCDSCRRVKGAPRPGGEEGEGVAVHTDLHIVKKAADKKHISISSIRELIRALNMSSFWGEYKVGIVSGADLLSREAANALLKTLEEPKPKTVVILVAAGLDDLPKTIASRSQVINFRLVPQEMIYDYLVESQKARRSQAKNIARLSLGRPALARKLFQDREFYDFHLQNAELFLDFYRQDINARLEAVSRRYGPELKGQAGTALAGSLISAWEGVARDIMLAAGNLGHRIQYEPLHEKISSAAAAYTVGRAAAAPAVLERARGYLRANVSPRLSLEYIAVAL